jgi:phage virion morphogenesis protein
MNGVTFSLTLDDAVVDAALARLDDGTATLQPLMDQIGSYLQMTADRRFELETGPDGKAWLKSQRARLEEGQTLTDSARLRQSITHHATGEAVEVGTNVIYAAIHQFGGRIVPKNGRALRFPVPGGEWVTVAAVDIPARPYLGLDNADREEIPALVREYLADLAEGA